MGNLIDIQSQIEKLQKQANEIKVREFDRTVQDILAKMSAFGITLKDLQPRKGAARKSGTSAAGNPAARSKNKNAGAVVPAKYRGPNGETWTGRGLMPRWLSALVAQGRARDEFAIKD